MKSKHIYKLNFIVNVRIFWTETFKKFLLRFAIFLHIFQLIFKELFIVGTLEVYYENFHQIFWWWDIFKIFSPKQIQSFTTQPCTSGGRKKIPKIYHSHSTLKSYKNLLGTLCVKKNREIDSNEQSLCNNIALFFSPLWIVIYLLTIDIPLRT